MTGQKNNEIPDVQSYEDRRNIAIHRVGIKDIRHPVTVVDRSGVAQTAVGNWTMAVALPAERKGTHMSRFTQLLNDHLQTAHSLANFGDLFKEMNNRLESSAGSIDLTFNWFVNKTAPASGVTGMLDYQVTLHADSQSGPAGDNENDASTAVTIVIPVTTLCPCSREISEYGAHNQRSHVTIKATPTSNSSEQAGKTLFWEDLIEHAESEASSELYSQLKRSDEKVVTERAYDNPKFVEDLIRDIALRLNSDDRIAGYKLEVENFESIHNHSAYAVIVSD